MKSYLKESQFILPDGEALAIREVSAGGRRALIEATKQHKGDALIIAAVSVQAGVPELRDKSPDEILDLFPIALLNDLASAVLKLSGLMPGDEAQAEKN